MLCIYDTFTQSVCGLAHCKASGTHLSLEMFLLRKRTARVCASKRGIHVLELEENQQGSSLTKTKAS